MDILEYLERTPGFVSWLSMPFVPKDRRWSSLRPRVEYLSKDFVTEEQCRVEATTGITLLWSY
jgi:hypothetical protein